MLTNSVKKPKISGSGEELQAFINTAMALGLTEITIQGTWTITSPLVITSRANRDIFKIKGINATMINNVENGTMLKFISSNVAIWDRIEIRDIQIISTLYPNNSDCIHIAGGCFGGGIYNCYIGGIDGNNLIKGSAVTFESNHEDFGLTKNFEIYGCKIWYLRDYGLITRSLNSTPAYITINKSDIEMCGLGGIVGGYENIVIKESIIAYNGKTNNGGGINLAGVISYARNVTITDCGLEHNAGSHIILDRLANVKIETNTMMGLANGVNGFNCDSAIKCLGAYGVLNMQIENNRIESVKEGFKGIQANGKVKTIIDNMNQFVFNNGTAREYASSIKVVGLKEDGTMF